MPASLPTMANALLRSVQNKMCDLFRIVWTKNIIKQHLSVVSWQVAFFESISVVYLKLGQS